MEWYNILSIVLGSVGGIGGITTAIIAIYNAKPNKDKIDIENYHSLLAEEREERELVRKEFKEYKEEVAKYKQFFKEKYDALQKHNDKLEDAINLGYKCPLIKEASDCVIIRQVEVIECNKCKNVEE
jgi:hypothetical protein